MRTDVGTFGFPRTLSPGLTNEKGDLKYNKNSIIIPIYIVGKNIQKIIHVTYTTCSCVYEHQPNYE